jgi:hypothetical protein
VKVLADELVKATQSDDETPALDSKAIRGALDALNEMFPAAAADFSDPKLEGESGANDGRARRLRLAADAEVARRTGRPAPRSQRVLDTPRIDSIFTRG